LLRSVWENLVLHCQLGDETMVYEMSNILRQLQVEVYRKIRPLFIYPVPVPGNQPDPDLPCWISGLVPDTGTKNSRISGQIEEIPVTISIQKIYKNVFLKPLLL
jgi:hypothetical protein